MICAQHTKLQLPAGAAQQQPGSAALRWRSPVAAQRQRRTQGGHSSRLAIVPQATSAVDEIASSIGSGKHPSLEEAKRQLLSAVAGTERGSEAKALQRGLVEEAQVAVESFSSGAELDYSLLEGKWRLEYTTARDVLPLVAPPSLPTPLQIGRVYQRFSSIDEGRVQNIIEARLPPPPLPLLAGSDLELGLQFVVEASYEARTARSIALTFRQAGVQDIVLSQGLQNLLASPILPRGWWNQQLLLAIKQLSLSVPLTSRVPGTSSSQQLPVGINYMLTHLDEDMLIGRAQGGGGTFIFTREQPPAEEEGEGVSSH